ncbi:hypothetical protein PAXRUDRAFT_11936 [Paxillus rubicundulus Ve08.2h10]|uniref:Uncharacterized protein n=1 Tax=Paxillus rubicundulus Ve08.2h10 TaxID=930991 RepID=A0A0D0DBR9_9AGAM|nr:hypothetical protein PAXRUDRAFT_11936 [Paxillus rubicundulus Ve08.2h10]
MVLGQHHWHTIGAGHYDQAEATGTDGLNGHAPPSPILMSVVPDYYIGWPTPPPSPLGHYATGYTGPSFDEHAPCPPTPPFVPYSVDSDDVQWINALESHRQEDTGDFMPLPELNHYTSFGASTYGASIDFGYVSQHDVPQVPVADHALYGALVPLAMQSRGNPVLVMIKRAELDEQGLHPDGIPYGWQAPDDVDDFFTIAGGVAPKTGENDVDQQTKEYYDVRPAQSLLRQEDSYVAYYYPVRAIEGLQHSLRMDWYLVYPKPIPAVLIRTFDIVGPYNLRRRQDGHAYVVPSEDTIWGTVLQLGIDHMYRPISRSISVQTNTSVKGAAMYHPQDIVGSQFAVNIFLELPRMPGETLENPYAEYIGAYVLKVINGATMKPCEWSDIVPEVQAMVRDRAPHLFEGLSPPELSSPHLPLVQFCFYKWDDNIVGLADEVHLDLKILAAEGSRMHCGEATSDNYSESSMDSDSGFDTESDGDAYHDNVTSEDSSEEYLSFLDMHHDV